MGFADYMKEKVRRAQAIIADPAPVEKFTMSVNNYTAPKTVELRDGAMKLRGVFPVTPVLRRAMRGSEKVQVKAKIIGERFELLRVL